MLLSKYVQQLLAKREELKKEMSTKKGFDTYKLSQEISSISSKLDSIAFQYIKAKPELDNIIKETYSDKEKQKLVSLCYKRIRGVTFNPSSDVNKMLEKEADSITEENYQEKFDLYQKAYNDVAKNNKDLFLRPQQGIENTYAYAEFLNDREVFWKKQIPELDNIPIEQQISFMDEAEKQRNPLLDPYEDHIVQSREKELNIIKHFAKNEEEREAIDFVKENVKSFDKEYSSELSKYSFMKVNDVEIVPREAIKKLDKYPKLDEVIITTVDEKTLKTRSHFVPEDKKDIYNKEIANLKYKLSDQTKAAMKNAMKKMDDIGLVNDINMYIPEEGEKSYAFYKLCDSYKKINSNISKGNIKELVSNVEEYKKNYSDMQELLNIANANFLDDGKSYSGNLDIGRNIYLPPEFRVQEQATSQLSTLFISLKACRMTGISIEEYVEDPMASFNKAQDKVLEILGYSESQVTENISESIHRIFAPKVAPISNLTGVLFRGIDGIFSMEKDSANYAHNAYVRAKCDESCNALSEFSLEVENSFNNEGVNTITNMLIYEGEPKGFLQFTGSIDYDMVHKEKITPFNAQDYIKTHKYDYEKTADRLSKEVLEFLEYDDISNEQKEMFVKGASTAIDSITKLLEIDNEKPGFEKLKNLKTIFDTKNFDEIQKEIMFTKHKNPAVRLSEEFGKLNNKKMFANKVADTKTGFDKIKPTHEVETFKARQAYLANSAFQQLSRTELNIIAKSNLSKDGLFEAYVNLLEGIKSSYSIDNKHSHQVPNIYGKIKEVNKNHDTAQSVVNEVLKQYEKDLKVPGLISQPLDEYKKSLLYQYSIRHRKEAIEMVEQYISNEENAKIIQESGKINCVLSDNIMDHTVQDMSEEINVLKNKEGINQNEKDALEFIENNIKVTDPEYQSAFANEGFYKVSYVEVKPKEIMNEANAKELLSKVYPSTASGDRGYDKTQTEAIKQIDESKFKLNDDTKKAIKEISQIIDDMHIITPENVKEAEEQTKAYGFVTLHNSIAEIKGEIRDGNTKNLPSLVENYKTTYANSMKLLSIAKANFRTDGISYGANIDVTRNFILPSEIKIEEQAVSQISTILIAKKFCIVNNIDFDSFIDNPSKIIAEEAKKIQMRSGFNQYVDKNSVGNSLYNLTHRPKEAKETKNIALLMRAFDGLYGLEKDEDLYKNNIFARSVMNAQYEIVAGADTNVISVMDYNGIKQETIKNIFVFNEEITDYTRLSGNPTVNYSYQTDEFFEMFDRDKYIKEHEFDDKKTAERIGKILSDYSERATLDEINAMRDLAVQSIDSIVKAKSIDGKEFIELLTLKTDILSQQFKEKYKDVDPATKTLEKFSDNEFDMDNLTNEIENHAEDLDGYSYQFTREMLSKAREMLSKARENDEPDSNDINDIVFACQTVFNYAAINKKSHEYQVDAKFIKGFLASYFDKTIVTNNKELVNSFKSLDDLSFVESISKDFNSLQKLVGEEPVDFSGIAASILTSKTQTELIGNAQFWADKLIADNINKNIENLNNTNVKEIYSTFKNCFSSLIDLASKDNPIIGTYDKEEIYKSVDINKIVDKHTPSRSEIERDKIERNLENSNDRGMDRIRFAKERIEEIFEINKDNPRNAMVDSVAVLKVLEEKYATRTSAWKFFHPGQTTAEANAVKDITNTIKDHFDITDAEIDGLKMMDKDSILFHESVRDKAEPKKNAPKTQQELVEAIGKEEEKSKNKGMVEKVDNKEINKVKNKENVLE